MASCALSSSSTLARCHRPARPGDPVRRGFSVQALLPLEYWVPRSSRGTTALGVDIASRSRGMNLPELCIVLVPLDREGAGNAGCWPHPRALRAKNVCTLRTQETTGQPEQPALPAQWAYGLYVLSSVRRAFWPPSPRVRRARLDPSVAGSGRHDFAVRIDALVWRADTAIASRLPRS